jgi:hypothetical protein
MKNYLILSFFVLGCGQAPTNVPKVTLPKPDPLAKFKLKVDALSNAKPSFRLKEFKGGEFSDEKMEQENLADINAGRSWRRFKKSITGIAFDVRKTDSLVSPYTAILTFDMCGGSSSRLPLAKAQHDNCDDPDKYPYHHRLIYAYQDSQWVLKSSKYQWTFPHSTLVVDRTSPSGVTLVDTPLEWNDVPIESFEWKEVEDALR